MIKDLLRETKEFLVWDRKYTMLMFIVWFCRFFYILVLLAYNVNTILIYKFDSWLSVLTLFEYFKTSLANSNIWWLILLFVILFAIWYLLLYPVWLSAGVHALAIDEKSVSKPFMKWVKDFFLMFELNALALSFWEYTFLMTVLRLYTLDILSNWFAIWLILIWWWSVLFSSIFWQYAKFILVLEKNKDWKDLWIFEAIWKSISMTLVNFWTTFKWFLTRVAVSLLFYFRILIIIAVPLILIYFLVASGTITSQNQWIVWILWALTLFVGTYMMTSVWAYFTRFWYKLYENTKEKFKNG